ncbi:hypothetical protein [Roseivirga sp.]|uniref:hypothetical protein n=1 Tax=Roseivirga sp. TaxID=1964215 RepID=UPI002B267F4E|nr:hypothetical protein [Roseivirga sp.]
MIYFIIGFIAITVMMVSSIFFADKKKPSQEEKYLDDRTDKFILGLLLSTIASFFISMSADIPNSAGLGGFLWIIGPLISGFFFGFVYLIVIMISIKLKVYAGWTCITFNLATGIYLFFSA